MKTVAGYLSDRKSKQLYCSPNWPVGEFFWQKKNTDQHHVEKKKTGSATHVQIPLTLIILRSQIIYKELSITIKDLMDIGLFFVRKDNHEQKKRKRKKKT
jgi:hypothetical protein